LSSHDKEPYGVLSELWSTQVSDVRPREETCGESERFERGVYSSTKYSVYFEATSKRSL